ncbi:reverse transcriptase domain-containing protein [Tanacetum coccineum]|uniref:Reverse transcriptase domain-containing protein n=1 Tax=Tanacetum coccineum TaxID=301880 RepID=A0ABQ5H7H4_9ASTR
MAPKRATRSTPVTTTTTTSVTNSQLKETIDQGVFAALAARDAYRNMNGEDSHNLGTGVRRMEQVTRALTWCNSHVRTVGHDVTYAMTWADLKKKMTNKNCPRNEMKKLEAELWNFKVKESDKIKRYVGGLPDMIHGSVASSKPKRMQEAIEMATELMDKKIRTFAERVRQMPTTLTTRGALERVRSLLVMSAEHKDISRGSVQCDNRGLSRLDNQSIERDRLIGIGFVLDFVEFISFTFGDKEMILVIEAFEIYSWRGARVDVRTYLLGGVIDGSKANGIIRNPKLELESSRFTFDLAPLSYESVDVIVGENWLLRHKVEMVCHEKVVKMPWISYGISIRSDADLRRLVSFDIFRKARGVE